MGITNDLEKKIENIKYLFFYKMLLMPFMTYIKNKGPNY